MQSLFPFPLPIFVAGVRAFDCLTSMTVRLSTQFSAFDQPKIQYVRFPRLPGGDVEVSNLGHRKIAIKILDHNFKERRNNFLFYSRW